MLISHQHPPEVSGLLGYLAYLWPDGPLLSDAFATEELISPLQVGSVLGPSSFCWVLQGGIVFKHLCLGPLVELDPTKTA